MPAFSELTALLGEREVSNTAAYLAMGLDTLAYVPLEQYRDRLEAAITGMTASRYGGGDVFAPHVLQLDGELASFVAVEGTRHWPQWCVFVEEAGVMRWPYNRGTVFQPFGQIAEPLALLVFNNLPQGVQVHTSGHSLGAAVCCLVAQYLAHQQEQVKSCWLFGCPRFAGQDFVDAYGVSTWFLSHPNDPVTLMPPNVVRFLGRDPLAFTWSTPLRVPGQWRWLPTYTRQMRNVSALDWCCAMASQSADFRRSSHQTYRYLRDIFDAVPVEDRTHWELFTDLLIDLGLFDPWPA